VIAVSGSTRDDLVRVFGLDADRVTVVHNGVTEDFRPAPVAEVEAFRQAKGLPVRFVLFVGTIEPRKNLVRLVEAYAQLPATIRQDTPLVIGGGKGWFYAQVFRRVVDLGLEGSVLFPGFLPMEELPWWYRASSVFVYPSVFEGFGLPVLEALASGTPVITSNTSSLPEVAGDAAILVDPYDTLEITNAMLRMLTDRSEAEAMRELGTVQAAKFSWQRTARETEAVYRSVLER
jgi:glycosyltransferase involved in cell wall biosynthesis